MFLTQPNLKIVFIVGISRNVKGRFFFLIWFGKQSKLMHD